MHSLKNIVSQVFLLEIQLDEKARIQLYMIHVIHVLQILSFQVLTCEFQHPSSFCHHPSSVSMESTSYFALNFFRVVLQLFYVITVTLSLASASVPSSSEQNNLDRLSLLAIKSEIELDPVGALSSWNDSLHHCDWKGIICSRRHPGRVIVLHLQSQNLKGTLSPHIGNLTFLKNFSLGGNNFHGVIPQEIGGLFRLQSLNLNKNSFIHKIPANLTHCSDLRYLDLGNNHFSGSILPLVSSFTKIVYLYLDANHFSGYISSSLGNLSSLTEFSIAENHMEGSVSGDLCRIKRLGLLDVAANNLTGKLPSCLYNQSNMYSFSVTDNQLEGSLPSDIGFTLPKIKGIHFDHNKFSGPIPSSLPNATDLTVIEFGSNSFTGSVPTDIGRSQGLRALVLHSNRLGTKTGDDLKFTDSLTNCTNLQALELGTNLLSGHLPVSISNLSSKFTFLDARENMLYGEIPIGLGNLVNVEYIQLSDNGLSGSIPASIGNLTRITNLDLGANKLDGNIPATLGNCINLLIVDVTHNNLVGSIPPELFAPNLVMIALDFSENALTGSLPSQIGNLTQLQELYVSMNKLSGHPPESLGNCLSLEWLHLDNNIFEGKIPKSFKMLKGLISFDLSQNNLSGGIPDYLGHLPLQYLNLSFNHFEGKIPDSGVFGNISAFSVDGNTNLCGGIRDLKLPSCMQKGKKSTTSIKVILSVTIGSLCLLAFSCMLFMSHKRKTLKRQSSSRTIFSLWYKRVSYGELLKATNGFSDENLIGVGSHGSVYKGILQHINKTVAVKVIKLHNEGASKSFLRECNALRNIRHRNLLKIITACSTVDFIGNDFKALVFDFMPNGSLEGWLHPRADGQRPVSRFLNFSHLLNIAIDVASALEYLHYYCQPYVVHCDVKPSNVLLDHDMTAHVADFGIAKLFSTSDSSQSLTSSVVVKGSIGYVAPEYGVGGEVSTRGDVYGYGILLLEMFTRKKPTDDMFVNGLSLHDYAEMALPDQIIDITDPIILLEENDVLNTAEKSKTGLHESLISVMRLAVTCSNGLPQKRMAMSEVLAELHHIKERYQGV